jgi:hypothetical protein
MGECRMKSIDGLARGQVNSGSNEDLRRVYGGALAL